MKKYWDIFIISFLALFLELLVIRLVGTEIRIFAYLSNYVLLAVFLGTGLGMILKKKTPLIYSSFAFFLIIIVLTFKYIIRFPNLEFKLFSGMTELLSPLSESYIWLQIGTFSKTGIGIGIFLTLGIFALITFAFIPLGKMIGEKLNAVKSPLVGYSVNVAGSLFGMWVFDGVSFMGVSPYFGLITSLFILFLLIKEDRVRTYAFILLIAAVIILFPKEAYQPYEKPVTFWSPYQKLILSAIYGIKNKPGGWYLEVNNAGYMGLLDLSEKSFKEKKTYIQEAFWKSPQDIVYANQYNLPYIFKPAPENLLIIGGGGGNDAAAAVRAKAKNAEVVEIDPTIIQIGRKYHPEQPYSENNIHVKVDDGRGYMERVSRQKKYDLIVMGLADSHTVSTGLTNVQLDNYLYTVESLRNIKNLLNNEGILFLTFEVTRPWIGERMQLTITEAFGYQPVVFEVRSDGTYGWGGIMFVIGKEKNTIEKVLGKNSGLREFINRTQKNYLVSDAKINLLTDDWPYVYLDRPRFPTLHFAVGAIVILFLITALRFSGNLPSINWPLFLFGAGFMLYEFRTISKSSLVFGNTWTTNLLIITGVMLFILLANFLSVVKKAPYKLAVFLLFASFILQVIIPVQGLNKIIALFFFTLPHLFSAVIFAKHYNEALDKSSALGSNLLGSVLGGFLEILSYIFGIQSLVYLAVILYGSGLLIARRRGIMG